MPTRLPDKSDRRWRRKTKSAPPKAHRPKRTAIFIGRFQPFHSGHLEAFSTMQAKNDSVKILIGSSNHSRTRENPLTFSERRAYIRSIIGEGIPIAALPDDPSDATWLLNLRRHLGMDGVVYSGNDWVLGLCREAGIPCHEIVYNVDISATRIRSMIAAGDDDYLRFLPRPELPPAIFSVLRAEQ